MPNDQYNQRKRIRLSRELYAEPQRITSITLSTLHRETLFANHDLTAEFVESLRNNAIRCQVSLLIYCFMPDHVHLLVQNGKQSDLIRFINSYKSWTTRVAWRYGFEGSVWQRSFYDHLLRDDESVERHIRYIIENPVRAGIVDTWIEYPYTGSFALDLREFDL